MHASTVDQPQEFKKAIIDALDGSADFVQLRNSEPYKNWNVQVTVNFLGGEARKVEITRLSRK